MQWSKGGSKEREGQTDRRIGRLKSMDISTMSAVLKCVKFSKERGEGRGRLQWSKGDSKEREGKTDRQTDRQIEISGHIEDVSSVKVCTRKQGRGKGLRWRETQKNTHTKRGWEGLQSVNTAELSAVLRHAEESKGGVYCGQKEGERD